MCTSKKLKSLDDNESSECYINIHSTFSHGDVLDVDLDDFFFFKLKVLQVTLPGNLVSTFEILEFVKATYCYPNILIVYRILLTVPRSIS